MMIPPGRSRRGVSLKCRDRPEVVGKMTPRCRDLCQRQTEQPDRVGVADLEPVGFADGGVVEPDGRVIDVLER